MGGILSESNRPKSRARGRARVAAAAAAALALVLLQAVPAYADYYDGGMPAKNFTVRYVNANSTYVGYFDTARSNWNNAPGGIGVAIGKNTTANATMTAGNYTTQSWYGLYTPTNPRTINRYFAIQINATTITRDSPNVPAWIRSTTTHELGHALSLADNPNTTAISLMKSNRDRTATQVPQAYDRSEVVRIYG